MRVQILRPVFIAPPHTTAAPSTHSVPIPSTVCPSNGVFRWHSGQIRIMGYWLCPIKSSRDHQAGHRSVGRLVAKRVVWRPGIPASGPQARSRRLGKARRANQTHSYGKYVQHLILAISPIHLVIFLIQFVISKFS